MQIKPVAHVSPVMQIANVSPVTQIASAQQVAPVVRVGGSARSSGSSTPGSAGSTSTLGTIGPYSAANSPSLTPLAHQVRAKSQHCFYLNTVICLLLLFYEADLRLLFLEITPPPQWYIFNILETYYPNVIIMFTTDIPPRYAV